MARLTRPPHPGLLTQEFLLNPCFNLGILFAFRTVHRYDYYRTSECGICQKKKPKSSLCGFLPTVSPVKKIRVRALFVQLIPWDGVWIWLGPALTASLCCCRASFSSASASIAYDSRANAALWWRFAVYRCLFIVACLSPPVDLQTPGISGIAWLKGGRTSDGEG